MCVYVCVCVCVCYGRRGVLSVAVVEQVLKLSLCYRQRCVVGGSTRYGRRGVLSVAVVDEQVLSLSLSVLWTKMCCRGQCVLRAERHRWQQ